MGVGTAVSWVWWNDWWLSWGSWSCWGGWGGWVDSHALSIDSGEASLADAGSAVPGLLLRAFGWWLCLIFIATFFGSRVSDHDRNRDSKVRNDTFSIDKDVSNFTGAFVAIEV